MENIGIVGGGFVGRSIYNGLSSNYKMFIYDKFKPGFQTLKEVIDNCDIIFVCVPTPMKKDGSQDLSNMEEALNDIAKETKQAKILILKSTILPGTTRILSEKYNQFYFIFNPEFLTERNAEFDFINQSRIVIGTDDGTENSITAYCVINMYKKRFPHTPVHVCTFEEAELTKYICNCFFAAKVSFMNEVYEICKKINVDYNSLRKAFLGDFRIANSHTEVPGPDGYFGYGGKCVLPESKLLTEENTITNIKTLYHNYVRKRKLPKIQSCDYDLQNINFKEIKKVTRRYVENEDMLTFKTDFGEFSCTKEHLLPIYRSGEKIVVQAANITKEDSLIISDEENT